jgi:serine protease Do
VRRLLRLLGVGVVALLGALVGAEFALDRSEHALPDFSALVARNAPAVVNVTISEPAPPDAGLPRGSDGPRWDDFFRRFFGDQEPPPGPGLEATGSGFIISSDGYVLTNRHVVADAAEVTVRLPDRREYDARVVGSDDSTDIALLQIEDAQDLPAVTLGDPGALEVGEWVLAIGSPFGFEHSVTAGIVSAKERALPRDNYVPFIQTDVAINPGNSGGPLFNLDGEVVGVNAQIYSRTGGFMGLSFAVPIDVALEVVEQLKTTGRVTRGWLGVLIQEVTRELAESFGLEQPRGALVARVIEDSPAAKAGLQPGDIILAYRGRDLVYSSDLPPLVGRTRIGEAAEIEVLRAGERREIEVTVAELPREQAAARPRVPAPDPQPPAGFGLSLAPLNDARRAELRLAPGEGGVLVERVDSGPARDAGLRPGDVVLSLDGRTVDSPEGFAQLIRDAAPGAALRLLVRRGEEARWLALRVPEGSG